MLGVRLPPIGEGETAVLSVGEANLLASAVNLEILSLRLSVAGSSANDLTRFTLATKGGATSAGFPAPTGGGAFGAAAAAFGGGGGAMEGDMDRSVLPRE